MIKKYPFLLSEFNDIMDDNNDIQILNKYINNLNKIQKLIIDNEGKYNPKEKIITPKVIDSNIFYGEKYRLVVFHGESCDESSLEKAGV